MKDRIKQIMENENLTPAKFADRLQINRAVVSHILNGRNNPSLDVVMKILGDMDYINPEWLLNGIGSMYKDGVNIDSIPKELDLFTQNTIKPDEQPVKSEFLKENEFKTHNKPSYTVENKQIESIKVPDKKITQLIIYYSDNTFETFIPHSVKN